MADVTCIIQTDASGIAHSVIAIEWEGNEVRERNLNLPGSCSGFRIRAAGTCEA